ncbi:MAG: hypothetical protein Fur006_00590 [Coleofasciculaceae cyanobacterium]
MKALGFKLKRLLKVSPFTLAFVLFPFASLAVDVKDVPNPRQVNGTWVTDMAQMLDEPTEAQLNSIITQLERKNGTEIAVVTVPETAPSASPKEFTTKLFNYWGIGKKGKDNGVLFLISQNERRVEIETGSGMEAILPDAKVGKIIDTQILPRFKQSDFNGGTLAGTKALVVAIETHQPATSASQTTLPTQSSTLSQQVTQDDDFPWLPIIAGWVVFGGGLVLVLAAINSAQRRQRRSCIKPPVSTSTVSRSARYSPPRSNVYSRSSHVEVDVDVDVDVSDSNDNDFNEWSYQLDSSDDSTGSSGGDGAGSSYESNWNSDNSSCSNEESSSSSSWNSDNSSCSSYDSNSSNWSSDSSDSSWNSDSSSCSSYDSSSSSSDFGGGSSGGDGAGSDW